MKKEDLLYVFLAMVAVMIIIFVNADKLWNSADKALTPLVNYNEDDNTAFAGAGSADPKDMRNIHINWEKGNVSVSYGTQNRITWKEVFVEGDPSQFNVMFYWMKSETFYINYFSEDYRDRNIKVNRNIRKDLLVFLPPGCVLNDLYIRNVNGKINCNVKANHKDIKSVTE